MTQLDPHVQYFTRELSQHIDANVQFYSEDDRLFFMENVISIMMTADSNSVKSELDMFLSENYENNFQLSEDVNEGIGNFLRGFAKGVGRVLGFGRPAEKIAFGAPPATTHIVPQSPNDAAKTSPRRSRSRRRRATVAQPTSNATVAADTGGAAQVPVPEQTSPNNAPNLHGYIPGYKNQNRYRFFGQ